MSTARALLVLVSILFTLLLCEIGLRLFTQYGASSVQLETKPNQPHDQSDTTRYLSRLPLAPGTDRRWFTEDPPPLPNRTPVSTPRLERFHDFEKRGLFGPQADYIWNRYYVESQRCAPNSFFEKYPDTVQAFDPPSESVHPRFRFPSNVTTAAGLVTNEFGLRGHPLTLAKPPKTIRIAFVGASTTAGFHGFAFSYPEYVENWLNRFAQANHFDVRFEALNAGREGLNSGDITAIVRDELLPLDPDLAVYYEGANQFSSATLLVSPHIPPRQDIDLRDPVVEHKVPRIIRTHLAIGDLLDRALNGFVSTGEPPKPAYRLTWPAGVNEQNPAVDNPHLPLRLPEIVQDLDSIRNSLASIGSQLVLCSFEWLAKDSMPLSPSRRPYIYKQLNTTLWPLRYADIRRLADFQNRVFRRYASARRIAFLDVASAIPQDPDLFIDAVHMTEPGDRLRAWIVFQQLVPFIRRQIESGQLPRAGASHRLPPPPSLAASTTPVRCADAITGPLERIEGGTSLATIEPLYNGATVEYGSPVTVITGGQQWSYAASFAVNVPTGLSRPCYVFLRARVVNGRIGLAIHDSQTKTEQLEKAVDASPEVSDIYVPILFPQTAGALIVRNIAPGGVRSRIQIEDVGLLAFLKPLPEEVVKTIALDRVQLGDKSAALDRNKNGLIVTTGPGMGAFAGRVPLGIDAAAGAGLTVHMRVRVLDGKAGVGILTPANNAFILERPVWPSSHMVEVILPLPSPPITGDLILRNLAPGNVASKATIEKIEIRKAP